MRMKRGAGDDYLIGTPEAGDLLRTYIVHKEAVQLLEWVKTSVRKTERMNSMKAGPSHHHRQDLVQRRRLNNRESRWM